MPNTAEFRSFDFQEAMTKPKIDKCDKDRLEIK